jgi:hypothetical protein
MTPIIYIVEFEGLMYGPFASTEEAFKFANEMGRPIIIHELQPLSGSGSESTLRGPSE